MKFAVRMYLYVWRLSKPLYKLTMTGRQEDRRTEKALPKKKLF